MVTTRNITIDSRVNVNDPMVILLTLQREMTNMK